MNITAALEGFFSWFTGSGRYMRLVDCMGRDSFWITLTVTLDLAVGVGYILIARHWGRNEKLLLDSPAKSALGNMKRIFLLCGLCGYVFIPIKMIWPAWRLYDLALAVLVYYTWSYAMGAQQLRVVYDQLDQTAQLTTQLKQSRDEARRKSIFLSSISHDLRTPLNGLSLNAELAEVYVSANDQEGLRQSLEEIRACARNAADLLAEFLEIGRIDWASDAVDSETFDVVAMLGRLIDANRVLASSKGLTLAMDGEPGLLVHTDRKMLERVLQNLVENGVKYTNEGRVGVEVSASPTTVEIHVVDTGIGIASEHHERIFDDFYQIENRERDRSKGFGLGLSIASRLVGQLGGELRLESQPGRGSRFIVRLPRQVAEADRVDPPAARDARKRASASTTAH